MVSIVPIFFHHVLPPRTNLDLLDIALAYDSSGPIVRVNPDELSIHDPAFYNEIYVTESKRRTNNYDVFCQGIDFDGKGHSQMP